MTRIFPRALLLLFVLAGLRATAQAPRNELALWTVGSHLSRDTLTSIEGHTIGISFEDDGPGFGISFNRYWTEQLSTELSLMTFRSDMQVTSTFTAPNTEIGELEGRAITAMAQWHFRTGARFSPYLGAGLAHIGGELDPIDDEEEDGGPVDLESEVTWAAAAGFDIRLTDHFALSLEAKRVAWSAVEEGGRPEDELEVDPMLYGAAVRFRF